MSEFRTEERGSGSERKASSVKRKRENAQQTPKIKRKLVVLLGFGGALLLVLILRLAQVTLVPGAEGKIPMDATVEPCSTEGEDHRSERIGSCSEWYFISCLA